MQSGEIVINGKFLLAALEGMPRVGREIYIAFDQLLEDSRFRSVKMSILAPKGASRAISLRNIPIVEVGRSKGVLWEQVEFPFFSAIGTPSISRAQRRWQRSMALS